jgi:hypothetical protein
MLCYSLRHINNPVARLLDPQTEIDIFEPERAKTLIETSNLFPDAAAKHQEGARGLIDILLPAWIHVEASITPVDRVSGPDPVDEQDFERQGSRGGEGPHVEPALPDAAGGG